MVICFAAPASERFEVGLFLRAKNRRDELKAGWVRGRTVRRELGRAALAAAFMLQIFAVWPGGAAADGVPQTPEADSRPGQGFQYSETFGLWPGGVPIPPALRDKLRPGLAPHEIAAAFLGIPFRADGALDERGRWILFAEPEREFDSPGFNCSGLAVAVSRYLFGRNVTLAGAAYDRLGDSGPDSLQGADWDFGLDLILNLTESYPRHILAPPEQLAAACRADCGLLGGYELRGVDIHSRDFPQLISGFKEGRVYFFSISRPSRKFPIGLSHYHVGLIAPDPEGHKWLYHTTLKGRTHRVDLASEQGLGNFRHFFPPLKKGRRMILIIETEPGAENPEAWGVSDQRRSD